MKILQTNLGRAHGAHDMAMLTAKEENTDLIIASEPNKKKMECTGWISDPNKEIAIYIRNKNLEISSITKTNGIVILQTQDYDVYACYMPPSLSQPQFEQRMDYIVRAVRTRNKEAIILGDFNAKSEEWCSPVSDLRGQTLAEAAASLDLIAHNKPGHPTFVRNASQSYIDVTFTTKNLARQAKNWTTLDNEPLTYHKHIVFEIGQSIKKTTEAFKGKVHINKIKFRDAVHKHCDGKNITSTQELNTTITQCYKAAQTRQPQTSYSAPYWWTWHV